MGRFTLEDKMRAVREYIDGSDLKKGVDNRYGVNPTVLKQWIDLLSESRRRRVVKTIYKLYSRV